MDQGNRGGGGDGNAHLIKSVEPVTFPPEYAQSALGVVAVGAHEPCSDHLDRHIHDLRRSWRFVAARGSPHATSGPVAVASAFAQWWSRLLGRSVAVRP